VVNCLIGGAENRVQLGNGRTSSAIRVIRATAIFVVYTIQVKIYIYIFLNICFFVVIFSDISIILNGTYFVPPKIPNFLEVILAAQLELFVTDAIRQTYSKISGGCISFIVSIFELWKCQYLGLLKRIAKFVTPHIRNVAKLICLHRRIGSKNQLVTAFAY